MQSFRFLQMSLGGIEMNLSSCIALCVAFSTYTNEQPTQSGTLPASNLVMEERLEVGKSCIARFGEQRERLQMGTFTASGQIVDDSLPKSATGKIVGPVQIFSAFDNARNLYRFDIERPARRVKAEGGDTTTLNPNEMEWTIEQAAEKIVRTADQVINWTSNDRSVITARNPKPGAQKEPGFDVRIVGASVLSSLKTFLPYATFIQDMQRLPIDDVFKEENGSIKIVWRAGKDGLTRKAIWFDPQRGYSPIRLEMDTKIPGDIPFEAWVRSETDWRRINEVWVPVTSFVEQKNGPALESWTLEFDWSSVNEPVDDAVFSADGLELPRFATLVDERLGRPIVVKGIAGSDSAAYALNEKSSGSGRLAILFLINAIVIGGIGVIVYWRRRRRAGCNPPNPEKNG